MTVKKHKDPIRKTKPLRLIFLGLAGLGFLVAGLLYGTDVALLNPKGYIAQEQFHLMLLSLVIILIIAVPVIFLFYFFAWKYRESNGKATYDPHRRYGASFVVGVWAFPIVIAIILSAVMWPTTHRLEPNDPIASRAKPLTIQVVAMRWKWLFIYPEQNIATVNYVQIPVNTPVKFELTADQTPMSSFWIPHLAGQLYAMTGHVNRLNIMAETPGDYIGRSAEINGAGFAEMKFTTHAGSQAEFDQWVQNIQLSSGELDSTEYKKLLQPTESHPVASYFLAETELYDTVLMKYMGSHQHAEGTEYERQGAEAAPEHSHRTGHE